MSHRDNAGFALAAVMIFFIALSVLLAAAAPAYQTQARRAQEEELIFRGQEYVRAIQKYQRRFGIFPPDIDALLDTSGVRFLRRPYVDPITGEGFRLLTVNPDGSINGSVVFDQGVAPQDLFRNSQIQMFDGGGSGSQQPGGQPQFQGAPGGGAGFGAQGNTGGQGEGGFPQPNAGFGQQGVGRNSGGVPNFGGGGQAVGGEQGSGFGQNGVAPAGLVSRGTPTTPTGSGTGSAGDTPFSSGGVVGVAPQSEDPSLMVYNQRAVYNEWEFIALPGFGTVPTTAAPGGPPDGPGGEPNPFGEGQPNPFGQGQPSPFGQNP